MLSRVGLDVRSRFSELTDTVTLSVGQALYEPGDLMTSVYLPNAGLISMIAVMEDGRQVQTGVIGHEGAIGMSASGYVDTAFTRMEVQLPGHALVIDAERFEAMVDESVEFCSAVSRYRDVLTRSCIQSVACNALHSTQRRCARWILTANDYAGGQKLPITQSFLAAMLGLKRNAVSRVARDFQQLELIRTRWGTIEILNADFLGDMACECYGVIRREIARLIEDGPSSECGD